MTRAARSLRVRSPRYFSAQKHDAAFPAGWREQLLDRTWAALADPERATGQPHDTDLRLRADRPNLSGEKFAAAVGGRAAGG